MARKPNMNDMMRSKRQDLQGYMYPGDKPGGTLSLSDHPDGAEEASDTNPNDAETPAESFQVLEAGDPSPKEPSFVYEPYEGSGGAWVVYPPGVACDENERRVAMDHPATAEDFDQMAVAVKAGGPSKADPESASEDMGEMGA